MLKTISPLVSAVVFTRSKNPKAAEPAELLRIFNTLETLNPKKTQSKTINNPKNALKYAKKIAGSKDLVVVVGSIYMVGEII